MSEPLRISPRLAIPEAELTWRFSRSSGPGGQSVNTADSRVELCYDVANSSSLPEPLRRRVLERLAGRLVGGVLTVVASEHRSQLRNREAAADRLVDLLRAAVAPPPPRRRPTRPSRRARQLRVEGKRAHGTIKKLRQRPPED